MSSLTSTSSKLSHNLFHNPLSGVGALLMILPCFSTVLSANVCLFSLYLIFLTSNFLSCAFFSLSIPQARISLLMLLLSCILPLDYRVGSSGTQNPDTLFQYFHSAYMLWVISAFTFPYTANVNPWYENTVNLHLYIYIMETHLWPHNCFLKLNFRKYPAIHTHYSWSNCTISN